MGLAAFLITHRDVRRPAAITVHAQSQGRAGVRLTQIPGPVGAVHRACPVDGWLVHGGRARLKTLPRVFAPATTLRRDRSKRNFILAGPSRNVIISPSISVITLSCTAAGDVRLMQDGPVPRTAVKQPGPSETRGCRRCQRLLGKGALVSQVQQLLALLNALGFLDQGRLSAGGSSATAAAWQLPRPAS